MFVELFRSGRWGKLSALEMADYADNINIISHNSVQDYIDAEWKGWLDGDISTSRFDIGIL